MPRALWLADALRAAGLDVHEVNGWQARGGPSFNPLGVLVHHTGGPRGTARPSLRVVVNGRQGLPGPLCQVLIGRDAACHIIASGRANHAGQGGPLPGVPRNLGNEHLVGIEGENDGKGEPWDPGQLQAMVAASAAILRHLDKPAANCWAHKEWAPGRKVDPLFHMDQFRAAVAHHFQEAPMASTDHPRRVQAAINSIGYKDPQGRTLTVDGDIGDITADAVEWLCRTHTQLVDERAHLSSELQRYAAALEVERERVRQLEAAGTGPVDARTVSLAAIGLKTMEWVDTVTTERDKLGL